MQYQEVTSDPLADAILVTPLETILCDGQALTYLGMAPGLPAMLIAKTDTGQLVAIPPNRCVVR